MKTFLPFPVLAIFIASCSKNDTTSDPVADLIIKTNMVAQRDCTFTQYTDRMKDKIHDKSGDKFKFNMDGTFVAVSRSVIFTVTWFLAQVNNSPKDDITADDKLNKLTISIAGNKQMDHLSHKWL